MIEGHGDDIYRYKGRIKANFSSNVYNGVEHSGLYAFLSGKMDVMLSYPEPQPVTLEERIANNYTKTGCRNISPSCVCATNGATEAIYLVAQAFAGSNSAIIEPTFSEYSDACSMYRHKIEHLSSLEECRDFCINTHGQKVVWLCNPNNPTGRVYDKNELCKLIKDNSNVLFVIDQSYEFFTLKELIGADEGVDFGNTVLLHSMTKRYAVPGVRLGYMTASESIMEKIRKERMPWSVNAFAIETGLFLLENDISSATSVPQLLERSRNLAESIEKIGGVKGSCFKVHPSDTHYMLVHIVKEIDYKNGISSCSASVLKEHLAKEHGILIRDASNFALLDKSWFRIATQTPNENILLIKALEELCL